MNRFGAALSTHAELEEAIEQVCEEAVRPLAGARPSLAVLFVSLDHESGFPSLARSIRANVGADCLIGCSGGSVVGGGREVEQGPCLSLWLASFPEGEVEGFQLDVEPEGDTLHLRGFPGLESAAGEQGPRSVMLLGDPYSFPADLFLQQLNEGAPGIQVIGGMASGGSGPGTNALFMDDECIPAGAVGAILHGIPVRHVVSQGCRPVGRTFVITRSHENRIDELADKPPYEQLKKVFEEADAEEKALLQRATRAGGLHIGQVIDELQSTPKRGDFLVRNVMRVDAKSGAMQIGDQARRGRSVRFHVRDAASADEDLRQLLTTARAAGAPGGALLFTCNGRGTHFFDVPDHDAASVQQHAGPLPAAGFFAAGEIGPVGGKNFLHGFTASIALFDGQ